MDKKVEEYINRQPSPQKEIITRVRKIFFKVLQGCGEKINWGVISLSDDKFYVVCLKDINEVRLTELIRLVVSRYS